jgi:hypothetical protein
MSVLGVRPTLFVAVCLILLTAACDRIRPRRNGDLPPIDSVRAVYQRNGLPGQLTFAGRVLEYRAVQDPEQLRRGGSLWARVGPYIYVFTPATREVFDTWSGVAAVRAITLTPNDREIARATLGRDELSDILWRRSLNLLGHALQEGTARPRLLEQLVSWGEEHTEYRYDPEYVPR